MSEEGSLITEAMIKKATYLIHKLANQRNKKFEEIRDNCKKMFGYMNLAKLSLDAGHAMISKLIELTGGEEETPATDTTVKDDSTEKKTVQELKHEKKEGESIVVLTMREAVRASVNITIKEVVDKDVPVQGLGGFVLEIAKVIFEAKMSEEANK